MRKVVSLVLAVGLLMVSGVVGVQADDGSHEQQLKNSIAAYVEAWVLDNYSEHYTLSEYRGAVEVLEIHGRQFKAFVPMVVYTTLKYDSIDSLPYVQGMNAALNIPSLEATLGAGSEKGPSTLAQTLSQANPNLDPSRVYALVAMLSDQYRDFEECIGVPTELSLDFSVTGDITSGKIGAVSLFVDEMGTLIDASYYVPKSKDGLKAAGQSDIDEFLGSWEPEGVSPLGYDSYDRIAARDYALQYTSNATTDCNCGDMYGVDSTCWNNTEYPFVPTLCHADYADFVSQAMHEGGIPIDPGKWERCKDGANGWSWTSVTGLTNYMTGKGY